jgi:hypothetical protein
MGMFGQLAVGGIKLLRAEREQTLGLKPRAALLRQACVDPAECHARPIRRGSAPRPFFNWRDYANAPLKIGLSG